MRKEFFSDEIREKAYDLARMKEGELAADIGAGTGYIKIESDLVDYAMANMFLHHAEDSSAAICEMVRIIKPGEN